MQTYCASCTWWDKSDDEALDGKCRRRSPLDTGGMMSNVETVWPSTNRDDWCGDYQSARSPDDLAQACLDDLTAGHSLRKTAARQGTTLAVVRGIQVRARQKGGEG